MILAIDSLRFIERCITLIVLEWEDPCQILEETGPQYWVLNSDLKEYRAVALGDIVWIARAKRRRPWSFRIQYKLEIVVIVKTRTLSYFFVVKMMIVTSFTYY